MTKITDFFKNCKYGIMNLIIWFHVIWKDRDWDQWYLYNILRFKLERMEKIQREYGCHNDSNKTADQIKLCINLLSRLIDDNYLINALKPHEKKWGESKMTFTPLSDDSNYLSSLTVETEKVLTKKEKALEHKERMIIYTRSEDLETQDLDMLFNNMRKYIEGWWD